MKLNTILLSGILLASSGCSSGGGNPAPTGTSVVVENPNKPVLVAAITSGAEFATNAGLAALSVSNPTAATEAAAALKDSITTNLLPYLHGGKIGTSVEIHDLINSTLFANVNPAIRNAIAMAGAFLDAMTAQGYLPVPSASTKLTPDQIDYVSAFLTGVANGCADFQTKAVLKPHWIEMK